MKKQQIIILVALLALALVVGACGSTGGAKKKEKAAPAAAPAVAVPVESATPTMGKEFMDLKKAHEQGAITDEEYKRAKEKLIGEGE